MRAEERVTQGRLWAMRLPFKRKERLCVHICNLWEGTSGEEKAEIIENESVVDGTKLLKETCPYGKCRAQGASLT